MASSDYDGGTGGKFRKRPFRRAPAPPYDRPQVANRRASPSPSPIGGNNRWISKIVDPASRIIGRSASKLFSSVLQKRLSTPPATQPPPSGENLLSRHEAPEATCSKPKPSDKALEQDVVAGENAVEDYNTGGIRQKTLPGTYGFLELEQRLKQKTFTRAEFEHLTDLLRSRTVEPSTSNLANRSENKEAVFIEQAKHNGESTVKPNTSPHVALRKEQAIISMPEDRVKSASLHGFATYPAVDIPEEGVGSPAEIAKAYMGSRPSKVSPTILGLRSRIIQEDSSLSTVPHAKKSSTSLLASRHSVHFSGNLENSANGYLTPRPRGRSALYRTSRSPYFKVHPTTNVRVGRPVRDGLFPSVPLLSNGKQVLKRRSSELDSNFESCGPIRRIRQKSNLLSPSSERHLTPPGKLLPSLTNQHDQDVNQRSASSGQKPVASIVSVPPQSTEMARKIFQELGKLEPSPKGKISEEKGKIADFGISGSAASPSEKEPTPQLPMAGDQPGESLELRTVYNMDCASGPLGTGSDKLMEKSLAHLLKGIPASSSVLNGKTDANASDSPCTGKEDESTPSASPSSAPQLSPKSTSPLADRSFPKKELLTSTVTCEATSMKVGASATSTAGIIDTSCSDKEGKTQKDVNLYKSIGNATSSGLSTTTSSVLFPFGASTGLNQSNGSLTSVSSSFSASAGTTSSSNNSIKANSSSPSVAPVEPKFVSTRSFQFGSGSSISIPISVLPSRDKSDTGDTDRKSIEASLFTINSSNAPAISNACSNTNMAGSASATSLVFSSICSPASATSSVLLNTASGSSLLSTSSAFTSPVNGMFGVSTSSQPSSSTSSFGAQPTQSGSGTSTFPHSSAVQCGSFLSGPSLGLNVSSPLSSSISTFGSTMEKAFGSHTGISSSLAGSSSSSSMPSFAQTATTGLFSSNALPSSSSMSASTLGSNPSLPHPGLPASTLSNLTPAFGASSGSLFSFSSVSTPISSTSPPLSQHVFGTPMQDTGFRSGLLGSDRMNIEDSMTCDNVQAPAQSVPVFGQPATPSTPNFQFGHPSAVSGQPATSPSTLSFQSGNPAAASGESSVFQFGSQHNSTVAQNLSPFHTAGSFEFSTGGSFSLGSGGGGDNKSGRRIVRIKRDKHRKK